MIGFEDAEFTFEYDSYYKILPNIFDWASDPNRIKNGKKVAQDFTYSSDNNFSWMTVEQLQHWIRENLENIGKI